RVLNGDESGKQQRLDACNRDFAETCWKQRKKHLFVFKTAFQGFQGSKEHFRDKVYEEWKKNQAELVSYEQLKQRAETVFNQTPVGLDDINSVSASNLPDLERHRLLKKVIVGSGDVGIAALIEQLKNSDWVKEGIDHFEK